jgi:hypothetical protein
MSHVTSYTETEAVFFIFWRLVYESVKKVTIVGFGVVFFSSYKQTLA